MSRPSEMELRRLSAVADELREIVSERSYRVGVAIDVDPAFGSGTTRSSLLRDLVFEGVGVGAGRVGVDFRSVLSGRELRPLNDVIDRRYRVRRARRDTDGSLVIHASSASSYATEDEGMLLRTEQWVFAWIVSGDEHEIEEILVAEVLGLADGHPGRLILGEPIPIGTHGFGSPFYGFKPSDEGLPGFGDEPGDDETVADGGPALS